MGNQNLCQSVGKVRENNFLVLFKMVINILVLTESRSKGLGKCKMHINVSLHTCMRLVFRRSKGGLDKLELLDFLVKTGTADTQQAGGFGLVPVCII